MSLTRNAPMRQCGRRYATEDEALSSKRGLTGDYVAEFCACLGWHLVPAKNAAPAETGFSAATRLAIRVRAGHGNPEDAHCEICGVWLGRTGGQCHHRQNRQAGGSKLRNGVANGALACGNPVDLATCHGKATALDVELIEAGWVLKSGQNPLLVPVALAGGVQSGIWPVWLTADGAYSFERPEGASAA